MKIRTGFVSNSSSSSFVLHLPITEGIFKGMYKDSEVLNKKDLEKAVVFGFRATKHHLASQLEDRGEEGVRTSTTKVLPEGTEHLGYSVSCNEDEVIEFLVKNNIPFTGSTHYGHSSCFFKRGDKTVLWMDNLGLAYEMYGHGGGAVGQILLANSKKTKPIRREPIKNYTQGRSR
jgi:hypothetical protein